MIREAASVEVGARMTSALAFWALARNAVKSLLPSGNCSSVTLPPSFSKACLK
jgi:hypothetical protein